MTPAWIWTVAVVVLGGIVAIFGGSYLSGYEPWASAEFVGLCLGCVLAMVYNNFPALLAVAMWTPWYPHLPGLYNFPAVGEVCIWIAATLFFKLCLKGSIPYRQSFAWPLLICFSWVVIRFLMNPVKGLGAASGLGAGVSGAMPYFNYVLAAALLVFIGAVLYDRQRVVSFMRWCFWTTLVIGVALTICAFIPATQPFLQGIGLFAAGNIADGVQRLVNLPGYGLFVLQAALCPALFKIRGIWKYVVFFAGFAMIVIGGNRGVVIAVFIAVPLCLLLRRRTQHFLVSLVAMAALALAVRVTVGNLTNSEIPGLIRCFGILDHRIDEATGGEASAQWRYAVWEDAMTKIMQSPLTGKGFGNLPQHLQSSDTTSSPDFEAVLAGGEAHNGYITAAYGFGIPFAVFIGVAELMFFFKESALALTTNKHDEELRDLHVFLAATFAGYPPILYTAIDLSTDVLWIYVAISCIASRLPRLEAPAPTALTGPLRRYGEEARYAAGSYYRSN